MAKSKLTAEETKLLVTDFENGMTLKDLEKKYNVNWSTASKIAIRNGAKPRNKYKRTTNQSHAKTCPNCKKKVDVKGARYCPFCAINIMTTKEILTEKINTVLCPLYTYLPHSVRDEYINILVDIEKELKK